MPWRFPSFNLKPLKLAATFGALMMLLFTGSSLAIAQVSGQGAKSTAPPANPKASSTARPTVNPCVGMFTNRYELASIEGNLFSVKVGDKLETITTDKKTVFYRHGKQVATLAAFKDLIGKPVKYFEGDCDTGKDAAGHAYAFRLEDSDITAPVGK